MKSLASQSNSKAKKLKIDAVNNALEFVLTIVAYVLLDKFNLSKTRVSTIMKRIEYYATIILDGEMSLQDYKNILKDEYGYELKFRGR